MASGELRLLKRWPVWAGLKPCATERDPARRMVRADTDRTC